MKSIIEENQIKLILIDMLKEYNANYINQDFELGELLTVYAKTIINQFKFK